MPTYISTDLISDINSLFQDHRPDQGAPGPTFKRSPPRRLGYRTEGKKLRYPWPHLRVGDYVDVPVLLASRSQVTSAASAYTRNHRGFYFSSEAIERKGLSYTRVWRVRKGEKAS